MNLSSPSRAALAGLAVVVAAATALCLLTASARAASPTLGLSATDAGIGGTVKATAQLSGSSSATGEILFEVFGPADPTCAGTALAQSSTGVDGDGSYDSDSFSPAVAGTYRWSAKYPGDAENDPVESLCAATSNVAKESPGMTGNASDATVGGAIHDEVTISGGFSPSGNVTFSVFAPGDNSCVTPLATNAVAVTGGQAKSPDFVTGQAGSFRWTASYAGDANNDPVSLGCNAPNQSSAVGEASPALTGSASAGRVGSGIHDEVTLTGGFSPGGNVTFRVYAPGDNACGTPLETYVVAVGAGQAKSPDFQTEQLGTFRWTASYGGDANNNPVSLACNSPNQSSAVGKALPSLSGVATSTVVVGSSITDNVTMSGGFAPTGQLIFRAYGPGDETCTALLFQEPVPVSGNNTYSPAGFQPPAGLYRWTVTYGGDPNNEAVSLPCNSENQNSAVGTVPVKLTAGATGATVGNQIKATASIQNGAIPGGVLIFRAFAPADVTCSAEPAFTSTVAVAGNGPYGPVAFTATKVGSYRWTVAYSGDASHAAATTACGAATSEVVKANPSIDGVVKKQRVPVGTSFRDWAVLSGAFAPGGTVTFQIYGPVSGGCGKPAFVNRVAVDGKVTVGSDPFVPSLPGRYSFVASYSGDASNQATAEPCDSADQVVVVEKRTPKLQPLARLAGRRIKIRARLTGAATPSGVVNFRLYRPGDKSCRARPAFSGSLKVKANGTFILAEYLVTRPGIYRLAVGYSGDPRNRPFKASCGGTQPIRIGRSG